jgi:hypothetical protein
MDPMVYHHMFPMKIWQFFMDVPENLAILAAYPLFSDRKDDLVASCCFSTSPHWIPDQSPPSASRPA